MANAPAAAPPIMTPRRKRTTRRGAARSVSVSGQPCATVPVPADREHRVRSDRPLLPPVRPADPHHLLRVFPKPQFGRRKQAIDDVVIAADPVIDELVVAERPDDEERRRLRSEEHTSELQSLMRISYAVFCL